MASVQQRLRAAVVAVIVGGGAFGSAGAASPLGPDLAGGQDHPLLSRFAGAQLIGRQVLEFERGRFYLPRAQSGATQELDTDKPVDTEGRVTRLLYVVPIGKTPLEVHRNHEQALRAAGVKMLTAVDGKGAWWSAGLHWRANFKQIELRPPFASDITPFAEREDLYLYGTLERQGVPVAVSVLTGPAGLFARDQYKLKDDRPLAVVAVQIVEGRAMATGQVTVSADKLAAGLQADGKIALYGIHFDTGKAVLRDESKPQLEQMAALLRAQPALKVAIVGHTDSQGALDGNLQLSKARADAVVAALKAQHGVDGARLSAHGLASLAPVASNRDEAGRARNRRVELVER